MFENLTTRLSGAFDGLMKKGVLREEDVTAALREIRVALLEADVALPVARDFIEKVKEQAVGEKVLRAVKPGQQVVKIVHDTLIETLQHPEAELNLNAPSPVVILMTGLQGSGKTTTAAKLAKHLQEKLKKKTLLASLDIYRPAAQEQLEILANKINAGSLPIVAGEKPIQITERALKTARVEGYDVLILDSAGRLSIDDDLMNELAAVRDAAKPTETLLVADAMTGQDAVNTARNFHERIGVTGIVLTRIDGDARGGAALSMRAVTGRPIKFLGLGEQVDALQAFDAARIAGRILDMGDVVSLVEKAAETIEMDEAQKIAEKMQKGKFDLDDFLMQMRQMKKMGGISGLLNMLPGMGKLKGAMAGANIDDNILTRQEAILLSMTKKERAQPELLNASRRKRIAAGSGTSVQDVNKLIKQFMEMQTMMKRMKKSGGMAALMKNMPQDMSSLAGGGMADLPPSMLGDNPFAPGGPLAGGANPFGALLPKDKKKF